MDNGPVGEGEAYNAALLQVVGSIDIQVKTDAPSVEKKVQEDDKCDDIAYGEGYNDVADYNIGDQVPFKLIGTVPDMSRYDTYKYVFHDTLSDGLTLNQDTVKVYVASDKAGSDKTEISGWTADKDAHNLTVSFSDLKAVEGVSDGKYIIVEYTATLNSGAAVGLPGNLNTVYLTYSNNPNESGEGKTKEDKVIVFTYELDTTKVDGQKPETTLKDAEFVLMSADQSKVAEISGGKFVKWVDDTTITKNGDGTYPAAYTLKSGTDGKFALAGLDDGTYCLKETKAPAGYNMLEKPIKVVITASTANGQEWNDFAPGNALTHLAVTADNETGAGDVNTGIAAITVANNAGSTLPETGGIGTTIFYAVGSVLVLAAVVLLVAKKRMSARD